MKFEILNLSCGYGKKLIVKNFNASLQDGEILCLLGQNGIGKTTIFKSVLGFLKPFGGQVFLGEQNLSALSDIERAKALSYVPQAHTPPFAFKVIDVVLMGRTPYLGTFENPTRADVAIAYEKLEMLGMSEFCDRVYTDLSGGERQMVLIASALAQDSSVIMLDEPTANLDFGNQIKTLKALTELALKGYKIVMTSHAPEHALMCEAKTAMLLKNGECIYGKAQDVVTSENLRLAYGADIRVVANLIDGKRVFSCVPMI